MAKLELDNLIDFKHPYGGMLLWEMFFADKYTKYRHAYPTAPNCNYSEINGRLYMHDIHDYPIMDFSISVEEIEDLLVYVNKIYPKYEYIPFERRPWREIGLKARELKEQELQKDYERRQQLQREVEARNLAAKTLASPEIPDVLHNVLSADQWLRKSMQHLPSMPLYKEIWLEKETCLLVSGANVGKSILATQIACNIAMNKKVAYFDYEMGPLSFAERSAGFFNKSPEVARNFIRCQPNPDIFICNNPVNHILADINAIIEKHLPEVVVIDSISFIVSNAASNIRAGKLMYGLKKIAANNCISLLVLADSAKRNPYSPISQNDIVGSKALFNSADVVLAIGQSTIDSETQYLKQLKSHSTEIMYGADHVILLRKEFSDDALRFKEKGTNCESFLLQSPNKSIYLQYLKKTIEQLEIDGKSQRDIADILGISQSKVSRIKNQ